MPVLGQNGSFLVCSLWSRGEKKKVDQQAGCSGYVLVPQVPHQRKLKPPTVAAKRLQGHSPAYRVNSRLEEAARLVVCDPFITQSSAVIPQLPPCRVLDRYGLVSALQAGLDVIAA